MRALSLVEWAINDLVDATNDTSTTKIMTIYHHLMCTCRPTPPPNDHCLFALGLPIESLGL